MKTKTRPLAPELLAAAHPGGAMARAQMQAVYERCLSHYRGKIRAHDTSDDVGAAVAHFVAACLQALHQMKITPAMLLRLERQLAGAVRGAWAKQDARARQIHFEKLAILAVLIAETSAQALKQGPAATDNVQRAARGYLRDLLGLDPEQLTLNADGLALRAFACAA